ncbi:MAG: spondin domain-containing protein [Planctomycetota bacterium]|jgi:hypothetical protein
MQVRALFPLAIGLLLSLPASAQDGKARYELTFTSTWSEATHPTQFPNNPHYSPLVGATHDAGVVFWQPGGTATPGIESMAETGSTFGLSGEINVAIGAGTADQVLIGPGIVSPASITYEFVADAAHPLFTMVSMLAPSPDWFIGVTGLDLRPGGIWLDEVTVDLTLWDAGTDAGSSYNSANSNLNPKLPIQSVTQASGPFQGASLVVGSFRLKRLWSGGIYGCDVNPAGSLSFAGESVIGETVTMTVDDPTGSMQTPAASFLVLSNNPWQDFPCGFSLPGLGMDPNQLGEVLVNGIYRTFQGPDWNGSGVGIDIAIPDDMNLIGRKFYLQGVLVGGGRIGVANAVELVVGQ